MSANSTIEMRRRDLFYIQDLALEIEAACQKAESKFEETAYKIADLAQIPGLPAGNIKQIAHDLMLTARCLEETRVHGKDLCKYLETILEEK